MTEVGLSRLASVVVSRELRLAMRRWDQVLQPLIFFVIVTTLFPLASNPDLNQLRLIGPGVGAGLDGVGAGADLQAAISATNTSRLKGSLM